MDKDNAVQRQWLCVCGRVVLGNGRASHQSACREYKEKTLVALEGKLSQINSGVRVWPFDSDEGRQIFRDQFTQEIEALKAELAPVAAETDG